MKTIKAREAIGDTLDYLVAKCEGRNPLNTLWVSDDLYGNHIEVPYSPSTDWAQGGPIMERECIGVAKYGPPGAPWKSVKGTSSEGGHFGAYGPTMLVAAMRCYVISKLGEEVTIHN